MSAITPIVHPSLEPPGQELGVVIRHTETGHASTTDALGCDQEVLKVEVREPVVPSGINGAGVDVLIVRVWNPGVVASRRRTALVVGSRSTKSVRVGSRHDSDGWFGW